jgi:hypothetical protein
MMPRRFSRPPRALRKAQLDNLVLVPASLLPFKAEYQEIANELPGGTTLIVLPEDDEAQRQRLESVAATLQAKGRPVVKLVSDGKLHQQQLF